MEKTLPTARATGARQQRVTYTRETIDRINTLLHNLPPIEKPQVDRYSMADVVKETRKGIEEALKAGYTYQQITDYLLQEGNIAIKSASLKSVYSRVKRSSQSKRTAKRKTAASAESTTTALDETEQSTAASATKNSKMTASTSLDNTRVTPPAVAAGRIAVEPDDRDL